MLHSLWLRQRTIKRRTVLSVSPHQCPRLCSSVKGYGKFSLGEITFLHLDIAH